MGDRVLSFGHEGILYKDSFLMYDHQTRSVWVHVTAECIIGDLKGNQLKFFPSNVTTWSDWKRRHPDTLVLAEQSKPSFLGTYLGMSPEKLGEYSLCLNAVIPQKAYPLPQLERTPVINDAVGETAVLLVYSTKLRAGVLWSRRIEGHILRFSLVEHDESHGPILRDEQTGSLWRGLEGLAVSGSLKETRLQPLTHHPILTSAFQAFYPNGEVYRVGEKQP